MLKQREQFVKVYEHETFYFMDKVYSIDDFIPEGDKYYLEENEHVIYITLNDDETLNIERYGPEGYDPPIWAQYEESSRIYDDVFLEIMR